MKNQSIDEYNGCFLMENPTLKWMRTGGTPMDWKPLYGNGSKPMKLPYDWGHKHPLTNYDLGYHLGPGLLTHCHIIIVRGGYKPTYNCGGPRCVSFFGGC